jgi:hypothetical protein
MPTSFEPFQGGCPCSFIRYKVNAGPIVINICHCHYCQRETGGPFAINYLTETASIEILESRQPLLVDLPSESGRGYTVARCPKCFTALYAHYFGPLLASFRAVTLDEASKEMLWAAVEKGEVELVHIFSESKVPWVEIPSNAKRFDRLYDFDAVLRPEGKERWARILSETEKLK